MYLFVFVELRLGCEVGFRWLVEVFVVACGFALSYVGLSAFALWVFICFVCVGLFGCAWFDVGFGVC